MTLTQATVREYDEHAPAAEDTESATFGLGCFWGPDATFGALDGVVRTRVGYAGGTKPAPSYHALGDHTEVVQVDFDPAVVSYADLVDVAFRNHSPRRQTATTQYQNVVFAASSAQRAALDDYLAAEGRSADDVETRIEQLGDFTVAEAYHQKHSLRAAPRLLDAFEDAGYGDAALRESPAAAKLNAAADGRDLPASNDLAAVLAAAGRRHE